VAEPTTTGEAIQVVRRAIYDLSSDLRKAGVENPQVTRQDIVNLCLKRKWPTPMLTFDKAVACLIKAGAADGTMTDYWLTAQGDLEEELARRSWLSQVLDEMRRPATFVGFLLGLASGLVLGLFRPGP
jgi:hypothetical protein